MGERCKLSPSPAAKRYLVHFGLKMLLVRAILSIYSRKLTNKFDEFIRNKKPIFHTKGQAQGPPINTPLYAGVLRRTTRSLRHCSS